MKAIVGSILAVGLAACAGPDDQRIGQGPITLSPQVEAAFEEYLTLDYPRVFAVDKAGRSAGYVFYPPLSERHRPGALRQMAINECEEQSKGAPCYIYAIRREIVWKGETKQPASPTTTKDRVTDLVKRLPEYGLLRHESVVQALKVYLRMPDKGAFAVSTSGTTWGWSTCDSDECQTKDLADDALKDCRGRAEGDECVLFALGDRIVWQDQ